MDSRVRRLDGALLLALVAFALLPWYGLEGGIWNGGWVASWPLAREAAPALVQIGVRSALWLVPLALAIAAALALRFTPPGERRGRWLAAVGGIGLACLVAEGLAIGYGGWNWSGWESLFGPLEDGQPPFGLGAFALALAFLLFLSFGLAERGRLRGDAFVLSAIALVVALVTAFVLYPLASLFAGAFQALDGSFDATSFLTNIQDPSIWSLGCLTGSGNCGLAWRTVTLAICTGLGTTILGLAFALVATRTAFPSSASCAF